MSTCKEARIALLLFALVAAAASGEKDNGQDETCAGTWTGGQSFTEADVPYIVDRDRPKYAVVTGGCSGLGLAVGKILAKKGWDVILGCRRSGAEAVLAVEQETPAAKGRISHRYLDAAELASVRAFAAAAEHPVHLLVNNAAVSMLPFELTVDGLEATFQINYLAHFALTLLLLPRIRLAAQQRGEARVVLLGSEAHRWAPASGPVTDLETLLNPALYRSASQRWGWYGHSKQGMQLLGVALAHRLRGERIFVNSVHPGLLGPSSGLLRQCEGGCFPPFFSPLGQLAHLLSLPFYRSAPSAAAAVLFPATSPVVSQAGVRGQWILPLQSLRFPRWLAGVCMWLGRLSDPADPPTLPDGIFFEPWLTRDRVLPALGHPAPAAASLENAERLWQFSQRLSNVSWPAL